MFMMVPIIVQIIVAFVKMFIMVINYILYRLTVLITICLLRNQILLFNIYATNLPIDNRKPLMYSFDQ